MPDPNLDIDFFGPEVRADPWPFFARLREAVVDKSLTWLIFLQRFAYRQVMYWVVLRSFAAALRGRMQGWGKLERKATVSLPENRRGFWTRIGNLLGARA